MGLFDWFFGKKTSELLSPGGGKWKVRSDTGAKQEALKQGLGRGLASPSGFAAAIVTAQQDAPSEWITISGTIQCNKCLKRFPFNEETRYDEGYGDSNMVKCPCGNKFTIRTTRGTSGSGLYVIVFPQLVKVLDSDSHLIKITIDAIKEIADGA